MDITDEDKNIFNKINRLLLSNNNEDNKLALEILKGLGLDPAPFEVYIKYKKVPEEERGHKPMTMFNFKSLIDDSKEFIKLMLGQVSYLSEIYDYVDNYECPFGSYYTSGLPHEYGASLQVSRIGDVKGLKDISLTIERGSIDKAWACTKFAGTPKANRTEACKLVLDRFTFHPQYTDKVVCFNGKFHIKRESVRSNAHKGDHDYEFLLRISNGFDSSGFRLDNDHISLSCSKIITIIN